jgi:thioredoxin
MTARLAAMLIAFAILAIAPASAEDTEAPTNVKLPTVADFDALVLTPSHDRRVIVMAWAAWCDPCRKLLGPLVKIAAREKKIPIVLVDIDTQLEVLSGIRITAIPVLIAYRNGEPVGALAGAVVSDAELSKFVSGAP